MVIGRTPASPSSSPGAGPVSGHPAVLELSAALPSAGRPRPRRAALHASRAALHASRGARGRRTPADARPVLPPGARPVAVPAVLPRPAGPAPVMWRPAGSPPVVPPPAAPGRRPGLARRTADPLTAPVGLRARLRRGVRRLALWGAGPTGAHLAWNVPPQPRVYSGRLPHPAAGTPAVVRTEPPSAPLTRSAASSSALLPAAGPGAAGGHLRTPVRPPRTAAVPRDAVRRPGRARTRGDPAACRIRGSPP